TDVAAALANTRAVVVEGEPPLERALSRREHQHDRRLGLAQLDRLRLGREAHFDAGRRVVRDLDEEARGVLSRELLLRHGAGLPVVRRWECVSRQMAGPFRSSNRESPSEWCVGNWKRTPPAPRSLIPPTARSWGGRLRRAGPRGGRGA